MINKNINYFNISIKIFTIAVLFFFTFKLKAENISDFEIEGISLGDSLLDYLNADYIIDELERTKPWYAYLSESSKFGEVYKFDNLNKYYFISFMIKPDDKNYIIHSIRGTMPHEPNLKKCENQMDEISKDISNLLKNHENNKNYYNHPIDQSNKSKVISIDYYLTNSGKIRITCIDFEENLRIENNWIDGLDISIQSEEVTDWLNGY